MSNAPFIGFIYFLCIFSRLLVVLQRAACAGSAYEIQSIGERSDAHYCIAAYSTKQLLQGKMEIEMDSQNNAIVWKSMMLEAIRETLQYECDLMDINDVGGQQEMVLKDMDVGDTTGGDLMDIDEIMDVGKLMDVDNTIIALAVVLT
ncbi:hypothetical protein BDR07DRAFT_1381815 [Suillus spraguei]|nr:hypothetical protein BDR07DRAFT_1381815 [Suillus spraguei]